MAITSNFNESKLRDQLSAFVDEIERKQIERLQFLGEKCVIEARTNRGYMMQTGALSSSTGYMIFKDGVALHGEFSAADGASADGGARGTTRGKQIAEHVGSQTKGICLVVVAGMNYALHVETRGYNVLASAEKLAAEELPKMLEKLIGNIRRAAE
jgi:hypothetical protein